MNARRVIARLAAALSATAFWTEAGEITLASVAYEVARANPDLIAARFMIDEVRGRHLGGRAADE